MGRPKKKRGEDETATQASQSATKLFRKCINVTCIKCNNRGHNSRSCKGQGGSGHARGAGGITNTWGVV